MFKKLQSFIINKIKTHHLIALSIITLIFLIIMNFAIFPKIIANTDGVRVFDLQWFTGYDYDSAYAFISSIGSQGKHIYLNYQLPLDFIFILVYSSTLLFSIVKIFKRLDFFTATPILIMLIDFTENACIYSMLTKTDISKALVALSSCMTICKSILLVLVILIASIHLYTNFISNPKNDCIDLASKSST
ncbi:MAG: hypothetical protein EOM05_06485 [Clostridia bacterium]|nr:hypothetical protein [Clostridia bacterium]